MKKFLLTTLLFAVFLSLVACQKKTPQLEPVETSVPETGKVLDISEKNGQEINVTPGDVLYLKLTGEGGSGDQWLTISPTSGDYLSLKDHQVEGLNEPDTTSTSQWWLKIEQVCDFYLQFDYGKIGEEPEDNFRIRVISQKNQ